MIIPSPAIRLARWAALFGLACGVLYSVGGFFHDLLTMGLNRGTALAFLALAGMPLMFGVVGLVVGALAAAVARRVDPGRGRDND